jgi:hypothetical protein
MTGRAGLSTAAQALLERRSGLVEQSGPVRRVAQGPERLSNPQLAQWLFTQLYTDRAGGALPKRFHLRGALNRQALRRALDEIVRRHEVLRCVFLPGNDEPEQTVRAVPAMGLNEIDLESLPPAEQAATAERLLDEDANRPFDLTTDVLLRPLLIRLGEAEF